MIAMENFRLVGKNIMSIWINVRTGKVLLSRRFVPATSTTTGGYWKWYVAAEINE